MHFSFSLFFLYCVCFLYYLCFRLLLFRSGIILLFNRHFLFEGLLVAFERRFRTTLKESEFQASLIKEIKTLIPGCLVLKNDPNYIQGIPDLTVFAGSKWASLECKKSNKASKRPNQEYYINKMNDMSFARFICPENKEDVLNELQQALCSDRTTCSSESE